MKYTDYELYEIIVRLQQRVEYLESCLRSVQDQINTYVNPESNQKQIEE